MRKLLFFFICLPLLSIAQKKQITLDDIYKTNTFRGESVPGFEPEKLDSYLNPDNVKDENGKNNRNDTDVVVEKRMWGSGDCVTFGMDGSISIRSPAQRNIGLPVGVSPGNLTDPEFFLRFLTVPPSNPHNFIQLSLPGAVPAGSKFHFCMKGTLKEQKKEVCRGAFRSESMFWKSRVLGTDAFCTYIYSYVFLF